jgi:hypothetical protein
MESSLSPVQPRRDWMRLWRELLTLLLTEVIMRSPLLLSTLSSSPGAVTEVQAAFDLTITTASQAIQAMLSLSKQLLQEAIDEADSVLSSLTIISISGSSRYSASDTDLRLTVSASFKGSPFSLSVKLSLSGGADPAKTFLMPSLLTSRAFTRERP